MSKRYYLAPIVGDGSEQNPFRAKVPRGVNHVAEIKIGPDGKPASAYALVLVAAINHLPLLTDPEIDALPDFPKDAKVNAMHAATKTAMRAAMTKRGIPTADVDNADGYRDVIRSIGRGLNGNFHEDNFDVSE